MLVLKFGGSSVESAPQMLNVLTILKDNIHSCNTNKIVVLSACKNITDSLQTVASLAADKNADIASLAPPAWQAVWQKIQAHHIAIIEQTLTLQKKQALASVEKLLSDLYNLLEGIFYLKELTLSTNDSVLAFGELLSTTVFYHICLEAGLRGVFVDARDLIFTDTNYGNASPYTLESERNIQQAVKKIFEDNNLIITQGFIASNNEGKFKKTTTLGRGGSDYAAAFIGAAINAQEIQIWTDVNGILSADPRVCNNTKTITRMEFNEVKELAFWGAKVIHPKTILPAVKKNINIKVLNSMNYIAEGTVIAASLREDNFTVKSVIAKENCVLVRAEGAFLQDLDLEKDSILYKGKANNLHVILLDKQLVRSKQAFDGAQILPCSAICITGSGMKKSTGRLGAMLKEVLLCLGNAEVLQIIYEFFDNSIVIVINRSSALEAILQAVHDKVINNEQWIINNE